MQRLLMYGLGALWLYAPVSLAADTSKLPPWAQGVEVRASESSPEGKKNLPAPFEWSVPGELTQIPIPGKFEAMGIPMDLHAVVSSKSIEELMIHFGDAFLNASLYIPPDKDVSMPLSHPFVTALDPNRKLSYTVIFVPNQDGTVTCVLGEAQLGQHKRPKPFAPVHPKGSKPLVMRQEGLRTLNYFVKVPKADVEAFYSKTLLAQGFREVEPGKYRRGRDLWWVQLEEEGGSTRVTLLDSPSIPTQELQTVQ